MTALYGDFNWSVKFNVFTAIATMWSFNQWPSAQFKRPQHS